MSRDKAAAGGFDVLLRSAGVLVREGEDLHFSWLLFPPRELEIPITNKTIKLDSFLRIKGIKS